MINMIASEVVVTVLSVNVPQSELTIAEYELFYDSLQNDSKIPLIYGDFNSHTGKAALCYESFHGGYGYGFGF